MRPASPLTVADSRIKSNTALKYPLITLENLSAVLIQCTLCTCHSLKTTLAGVSEMDITKRSSQQTHTDYIQQHKSI